MPLKPIDCRTHASSSSSAIWRVHHQLYIVVYNPDRQNNHKQLRRQPASHHHHHHHHDDTKAHAPDERVVAVSNAHTPRHAHSSGFTFRLGFAVVPTTKRPDGPPRGPTTGERLCCCVRLCLLLSSTIIIIILVSCIMMVRKCVYDIYLDGYSRKNEGFPPFRCAKRTNRTRNRNRTMCRETSDAQTCSTSCVEKCKNIQ